MLENPTPKPHVQIDALEPLLDLLELEVQEAVLEHQEGLEQLYLDMGRPLALRHKGICFELPYQIGESDIRRVVSGIGGFREDGRAGIDGTLHRISENRDRYDRSVGIHVRIGRVAMYLAEPYRELLEGNPLSLVIIGGPGSGKTSLLRDMVRISAERLGRDCVVVDTSCEVAGDGTVPHPCIGLAQRVQVPHIERQAQTLIHTMANFGPKRMVVDEIKRREDAEVVEDLAYSGVEFIATAHALSLSDFVFKPMYQNLVGHLDLDGLRRRVRPAFKSALVAEGGGRWWFVPDLAKAIDDVLTKAQPLGAPQATQELVQSMDHAQRMSKALQTIGRSLSSMRQKVGLESSQELEDLERLVLEAELF